MCVSWSDATRRRPQGCWSRHGAMHWLTLGLGSIRTVMNINPSRPFQFASKISATAGRQCVISISMSVNTCIKISIPAEMYWVALTDACCCFAYVNAMWRFCSCLVQMSLLLDRWKLVSWHVPLLLQKTMTSRKCISCMTFVEKINVHVIWQQ